jgi:hypothetical protein
VGIGDFSGKEFGRGWGLERSFSAGSDAAAAAASSKRVGVEIFMEF